MGTEHVDTEEVEPHAREVQAEAQNDGTPALLRHHPTRPSQAQVGVVVLSGTVRRERPGGWKGENSLVKTARHYGV